MGNKLELKHISDCGEFSQFELEADKDVIDDLMSAFVTKALILGIEEAERQNKKYTDKLRDQDRLFDAASLLVSRLKAWEASEEMNYDPDVKNCVDLLAFVLRDIRSSRHDLNIASDCREYAKHDDYSVTRDLLVRAADEIDRLKARAC